MGVDVMTNVPAVAAPRIPDEVGMASGASSVLLDLFQSTAKARTHAIATHTTRTTGTSTAKARFLVTAMM